MIKREKLILQAIEENPSFSDLRIAKLLIDTKRMEAKSYDSLRKVIWFLRSENNIPSFKERKDILQDVKEDNFLARLKEFAKNKTSIMELANKLNCAPNKVLDGLSKLNKSAYNVVTTNDSVELSADIQQGGKKIIDLSKLKNKTYKFGIVADTHLNSKFERLDILNALYDRFEEEGIKEVYHAGNYVDGEARFNKYELHNVGIDPQLNYMIEHYPSRKGITTFYIDGDDHEGWWAQRERINPGKYLENKARKAGRKDLVYLGYLEADVELKAKKGKAVMRVAHPGGGSSYALSYTPQKIVESLQGGEKPNIYIIGHYHKSMYMYYRDVHLIQAGCTQDQTVFMRKKKLQAALGGWIIEMEQSEDGYINRFKAEWISFLNENYYSNKGYYR